MAGRWIKNLEQLASSDQRQAALSLVNAALDAIDTRQVVTSGVCLTGDILRVKQEEFDLRQFNNIYLLALGKAAGPATAAVEDILGTRLRGGVMISPGPATSRRVRAFQGTHPLPSVNNVKGTQAMVDLSTRLTENDLVIVIVSGGGSALLCWPPDECEQGRRLYEDFVNSGGTITELNTVRKHLSSVKGGGLARMLHPATVVGLVFSDVPGDRFEVIASGPTYPDATTCQDAAGILEKYQLGGYRLSETPKEPHHFEKVHNVPLVSNRDALRAMVQRGHELGLSATILSDSLYDSVAEFARKIISAPASDLVVAGGEPEVKVPAVHGRGGRNQLLTLHALKHIRHDQLFISFGSDGQDNGNVAGAVADCETIEKARRLGLNVDGYLLRFDSQTFFEQTGDAIITGLTEANVSDLMLLLTVKK